uniref:Orotidine 5'-phosphate decarboxylase n=1 Tax=Lygus hesperus TaxID=30085 RepID=A0A0A9XPJ3_LYGHE
MVTVHSLPGPGTLDAFVRAFSEMEQPHGVMLLIHMSCKDNLITPEYSQRTLQLAMQYPDVVTGFISQNRIHNSSFITMMPGVSITATNDSLGQQYISPKAAILDRGADIIIVGRGIVTSTDPAATAELYRSIAWDAYSS